jgi:hypothetical protein
VRKLKSNLNNYDLPSIIHSIGQLRSPDVSRDGNEHMGQYISPCMPHVQNLGDEQDQDKRPHRHLLTAGNPGQQENDMAYFLSERDRYSSKQD